MSEIDAGQRIQLDAMDEEYRGRFGAAVEFLKSEIGPGESYENEVARVTISTNGAWFECVELPMEFSGSAGGPAEHQFVADAEAISVLAGLHQLSNMATEENSREVSILALYDRTAVVDARSAFAVLFAPHTGAEMIRIGQYQDGRLPRAYRARIDTDVVIPCVGLSRGILYCLAGIGDRNLLVTVRFGEETLHDLGNPALNTGVVQ